MAKIHEEIIVVKISTLLSDMEEISPILDDENMQAIEEVIKQIAGTGRTLIEIEKA